jgi:hypothetical protein
MAVCKKCLIDKPVVDFYPAGKNKQTHDSSCKECRKLAVRSNYRKNIKHYKDYDLKRNQDKKRQEHYLLSSKAARLKYPIRYAARTMVGNALRDNRLFKPNVCEQCKHEKPLDAHHCDYSKPLDVMWLCRQCHNDWHKVNETLNGDMP